MKILALIPARGGSKGIPGKNIKMLDGKPLIGYTIDAASESGIFNDIVVSTDDKIIADVARKCGASVPFMRPTDLASDNAPTLAAIIHAVEFLRDKQGKNYDAVCLLQATSPFRKVPDLISAVEKFQVTEADSLISVIPVPHEFNPHWVFIPDSDNHLLRIATGEKDIITRRQELPPAYVRDGSVYLTKTDILLQKKSLYGERIAFYVMSTDEYVNLDTMKDWAIAEEIINVRQNRIR